MRPILVLLACSILLLPFPSQAQFSWSKGTYPVSGGRVERADFNGDGFQDLLIHNGPDTISVLLNNGDGTFDGKHAFTLNQALGDVALIDFNRDGKIDVVGCEGNNVIILAGNGDGTLTFSHSFPVACLWLVAADFNRDGRPDIAVGTLPDPFGSNNQVIVYLGDGDGGVARQIVINHVDFSTVAGDPCLINGAAVAGDFTGDKVADIAITADCFNGTTSGGALIVGVGDRTGHFTFHKDVEFGLGGSMRLQLVDADQDGRRDIAGVGKTFAPFGSGGTELILFVSLGNGTFTSRVVAGASFDDQVVIESGAIADLDGDGLKDAALGVIASDFDGNTTHSLQVLRRSFDGTYKLVKTLPLGAEVMDMVWGDFNRDGVVDLATIRPDSTDVFLNNSSRVSRCFSQTADRSLTLCNLGSTAAGRVHFVVNPTDKLPIHLLQIYVDDHLTFQTLDDLLNKTLTLGFGQHHIVAKAWDDLGQFAASQTFFVCSNSINRTVKICSPENDTTGKSPVHILASAATSLAFASLQLYLDGKLLQRSSLKLLDTQLPLSGGTHHITVKGWDSSGQFSSSVIVHIQ